MNLKDVTMKRRRQTQKYMLYDSVEIRFKNRTVSRTVRMELPWHKGSSWGAGIVSLDLVVVLQVC